MDRRVTISMMETTGKPCSREKSQDFRHSRHSVVLIHQFAQYGERRKIRQFHQIDASYRMTMPEKTVFPCDKRENMSRTVQIGWFRLRRNGRPDPVGVQASVVPLVQP